MDHWYRYSPRLFRLTAAIVAVLLALVGAAPVSAQSTHSAVSAADLPELQPVDPQIVLNQYDLTWDDYVPIPGHDWEDPDIEPSVRSYKVALVLTDFQNRDFAVTKEPGSTVFGNPSEDAHSLPRDEVAQFYHDLLMVPQELNHFHTFQGFWLEQTNGRIGVELTPYGPYRMPGADYQYYSVAWGNRCPTGITCRNWANDAIAAWRAAENATIDRQFDLIFFVHAGEDEYGTWMEFGPMKFATKEDIPDEFGPPPELKALDPTLPNWRPTRYYPWTAFVSAAQGVWPNAGGGRSQQGENTGMAVYAHEYAHLLGVSDNYTSPYGPRRQYAGYFDLISRGHDMGPAGIHTRWQIPSRLGGTSPGHFALRNKLKFNLVDQDAVLQLSREGLADSGLVTARVTAREIQREGELSGINIKLNTGDKSPACSTQEWLCDGGGFNNYTVEVVDRMGSESFLPDHGVFLAKTKDADRAPFIWAIDANPEDINMIDYISPTGEEVMVPIGDARQLNDALFHAGVDSGSHYEYVDEHNRLHFYVLNMLRDEVGILQYDVAVRSLDGSGPNARGVKLDSPAVSWPLPASVAQCTIPLTNTGQAGVSAGHTQDVSAYVGSDVYRLTAVTGGTGWSAWMPHEVVAVGAGDTVNVPVYAIAGEGAAAGAVVSLTARSESDPAASATVNCHVGEGPVVRIDAPADGLRTTAGYVEVVGVAVDPAGIASVTINDEEADMTEDGNFSGFAFLDEGANEITVVATGDAGDTSTATVTVHRVTTAPELRDIEPAEDVTIEQTESLTVRFTSDPGLTAGFDIVLPGTMRLASVPSLPMTETEPGVYEGTYTAPADALFADAQIVIAATDDLGNTARVTAPGLLTVVPFVVPPELEITAPADGLRTDKDVVTVTGLAADADGIESVAVNGRKVAVAADGSFSTRVVLREGGNAITVTATGTSGKQATETVTVVADWTPPVIITLDPEEGITLQAGETYLLRFVGEPGLTAAYQIVIGGTAGTFTGKGVPQGTPMTEVSPGVYAAVYTAPAGTTFTNAVIRYNAADDVGNLIMITAPGRLSVRP